jgi:hypothetical protein
VYWGWWRRISKNPFPDWHLKIGSDVVARRRQQEEACFAMDSMAARIIAAKRRRLAELCPKGQARNGAQQLPVDESQECGAEGRVKKPLRPLRMPPMTGVAWYGVCSGNNRHRGYLVARPRDTDGGAVYGRDQAGEEQGVDVKFR